MADLVDLTRQLREGRALSEEQVIVAVEALADANLPAEAKAEFLIALKDKGETTEELAGFAKEFRKRSIAVPVDDATRARGIADVCGTGGDRLNTFNISSTVAILVAAAGVTVAKHGGRAITSQCGSAEVLETLGVRIDLTPEQAAAALRDVGFAFFFAPKYHPVFANIAPARKLCAERGHRTIFNLMGPLMNPARPAFQLVGVPRPEFCQPIAMVLRMLGLARGMVVCGEAGEGHLDELSLVGPTAAAIFDSASEPRSIAVTPTELGLAFASLEELRGGTREANAAIVRGILEGRDAGARRNVVLLNAGAALMISGRAGDLDSGIRLARETIDSGAAAAKLRALTQL